MWSGDKQLNDLKASLGVIRKESNAIISEVNDRIRELQMPEKEKMIQEIMTEIVKNDPEFPIRGLEDIEKNMRSKALSDLREIDYAFYFPSKTDSTVQPTEVESSQAGQEKQDEKPAAKSPAKTAAKEPAKATAPKTADKSAAKSTAKSNATKKPGVRSELAAAKKQADAHNSRKPAQSKTHSIAAELG
jgi:hypothetical protein